jgi:hypothetical protein
MNWGNIFGFCITYVLLSIPSDVQAKQIIDETALESIESVSWISPIRDVAMDGSMITYISKNPTAVPLFFPKLVPIFSFIDKGNTKFFTLEELSKNPRLGPRPVFSRGSRQYYAEAPEEKEDEKVTSLENRLRELEAKLLESQSKPVHRPNDEELQAFILEGNEHLSQEQRLAYLSRVISEAKQSTRAISDSSVRVTKINTPPLRFEGNDITPPDFLSIPEPPTFEESYSQTSANSNDQKLNKSILKFKASVPTPQGTERPAQASEFYLTTRNLHDLLSDLNLNRALAGEVKSVAELWAHAEKDSSANPEIALGVKSILLQAKVGKARTDPFGNAELDGVSPNDGYFLIGIDKDDQTGVVTIWSKHIEVAPGENMVELTTNDVIYHE